MAGVTGFSRTTIRRIGTAFGLQPHRSGTFQLSSGPLFVYTAGDIVGLYLSPPNGALVLSVDEKSQIQAHDREQPTLLVVPERRTHCNVHHSAISLFAALDIASGFVIGKCYKRHHAAELLDFLKQIDVQVPPDLDVTPPSIPSKPLCSGLNSLAAGTTVSTSRRSGPRGSTR